VRVESTTPTAAAAEVLAEEKPHTEKRPKRDAEPAEPEAKPRGKAEKSAARKAKAE